VLHSVFLLVDLRAEDSSSQWPGCWGEGQVHARMFAAMDANDDGRVTPEEMEGFMHGETK
jgi:hypothetical protein